MIEIDADKLAKFHPKAFFRASKQMIVVSRATVAEENATRRLETVKLYPDGTKHTIIHSRFCSICGISDTTYCTEEFNCLNVSIEQETRMKKAGLI